MSRRFHIEVDWERLDQGPPEQRSTFGAIGLRVGDVWLSEAHDRFVGCVRSKVHLSGYLLAEWLAWNWWRLRFEPRRNTIDWKLAHRLATVGGGYVWPNVLFDTDGERALVRASPTASRASEPLRYVAEAREAFAVQELMAGIEQFILLVLERLRTEGPRETRLAMLWAALSGDRADADAAWYRQLESLLGCDPDEADEHAVTALIEMGASLGSSAAAELAAGAPKSGVDHTAADLKDLARRAGHDADLSGLAALSAPDIAGLERRDPAWIVGEAAAGSLRSREHLGEGPLSDETLASLAGVSPSALAGDGPDAPYSFVLSSGEKQARLVLASPIPANRRFALARVVGDRLLSAHAEPLIPVLRTRSYRQMLQRAFAAGLLCPFRSARPLLDSELSDESQERVAAVFGVSPMLVRTQLVNNGLLDREALEAF